jgi:GNAT superfamily N-acetyltransferase
MTMPGKRLAPHLRHADTEPMARIDAEDDDLMRYVVRRYAYDPQRRERRHQIVAAFDNEREWAAFLDQAAAQLRQDGAAGRVADPHDHYTGLVLVPGYQRRQQNGRLIRRAIERGADISAVLVGLDLPSNMAVIRAGRSRGRTVNCVLNWGGPLVARWAAPRRATATTRLSGTDH